MQNQIEDIIFMLDELIEDGSIPKNIKVALINVKEVMNNNATDVVRLSNSIYTLQDISDDVNLPLNAKSDIWMLQSKLEKIKESVKWGGS